MALLINKSDFISIIKTVPATISQDKIDLFITEAQKMDVSKMLGAELLNDILSELDESPQLQTQTLYNLYNGCIYTCGDTQYEFDGLKTVMAYTTWFRLVREHSFNPTPFGIVSKNSEFSDPLSDSQIVNYINIAKEKYNYYIAELKTYLCRNYNLFPQLKGTMRKRRTNINAVGE